VDFLGPIVWRVQILFGGQVTSNYRLRHWLAIVDIDQTPSVPYVPCSGRESKVIDLNDGILCDDTSINEAGYTVITPES
jgi:hypothetical protein